MNLHDLQLTSQAVLEERKQRALIESSPEYNALQVQIDALIEAQKQMTAHIPDSSEEYELDKKAVIAEMVANNQTELDGFEVKIRNKSKVNTYKVLQEMDGDIDNLMLVATVTQASLTKFMKENSGYKSLKHCIEDDGYTITDLLPLSL